MKTLERSLVNHLRVRATVDTEVAFIFLYDSGIEVLVENQTVEQWCQENGYNKSGLSRLRRGNQKTYKNIIAMEYASERD